MPVINTSNNTDPEAALARKKRVKMLSTVVTIASLNIVIDILTGKYFFQSYTYLTVFKYRKVANSSLSRLVARFQIFRRLMKGKFDAYVL